MDLRIKTGRPARNEMLRRSEDHLRALASRAPEAEACLQVTLRRLHPVAVWFRHCRRRLATASIGVLTLWLFMHVMFGDNGMVIYRQKRAEYKSLRKEIEGLESENDRYTRQIKALKDDPAAIEREAREQLHYARPGEVIYVAPAPPIVELPSRNSAKR